MKLLLGVMVFSGLFAAQSVLATDQHSLVAASKRVCYAQDSTGLVYQAGTSSGKRERVTRNAALLICESFSLDPSSCVIIHCKEY